MLAATTTVLVTVGFVYERVVYAIAGWQRGTPGNSLYQDYDDYGRILLATIAGLLMWAAGGAMVGSSFYRGNERGLLSVAIAFAAVSLVGGVSGMAGPFAFVARQFDVEYNLLVSAVAALIATGVLAAITWWNVRKLALRNK